MPRRTKGTSLSDKLFDKLADKAIDKGIGYLDKKIGGSLSEKLADKAIDKGFDYLGKKYGFGISDKIVDKLADKAIDKGFDALSRHFGMGVYHSLSDSMMTPKEQTHAIATHHINKLVPKISDKLQHLNPKEVYELGKHTGHEISEHLGRGFDDATMRPLMKEIGSWLNPATAVELMGGGLEDANPLYLGYKLGYDVIGPALDNTFHIRGRGKEGVHIDINSHNNSDGEYSMEGDGVKKKRRGRPKKSVKQVEIVPKLPYERFSHSKNPSAHQLLESAYYKKMEGQGTKKRMVKGSPEAKEHMARIRAMKKK